MNASVPLRPRRTRVGTCVSSFSLLLLLLVDREVVVGLRLWRLVVGCCLLVLFFLGFFRRWVVGGVVDV
jgi:hypothetical protein